MHLRTPASQKTWKGKHKWKIRGLILPVESKGKKDYPLIFLKALTFENL